MSHRLAATFEAKELIALLERVAGWSCFRGMPVEIAADDRDVGAARDWLDVLRKAREYGWAAFKPIESPPGQKHMISIRVNLVVSAWAPNAMESIESLSETIATLPFEVCSLGDVHADEWARNKGISRHGFANTHTPLGVGCAFKGAGHDRLVSRRWLEHGPWRVLRGPDDLSVVQFHDLDADPETALAQALPGHERMGISETGGFIQGPTAAGKGIKYSPWEGFPEGLHDAKARSLEIVVAPGREVSQGEMLDACAYRLRMRTDKTTPIERIAYVFMTESAARAHLHELWLRELEVWTVDGGAKRRIDLDYKPEPKKPDWVLDLERRR